MKFDLVMGNPPYQNLGKDEANKMWAQFVKYLYQNHLKEGGVMSFITPTTWMTPSDDAPNFSIMCDMFQKKQLEWADIRSSIGPEYFPGVGQAFSIWRVTNKPRAYPTRFITDSGELMIDLEEGTILPKNLNTLSLAIIGKFVGFPWKWEVQKPYVRAQKSDENGGFLNYHTVSQGYWYSAEKHPKADVPKVCVSLSGYYKPVYIDDAGYTNMCITLFVDSKEGGVVAESVLSSKLYRWFHSQFKHGGFNNIRTIVGFPAVDLTRTWTDEELYAHFGLTEEEIAYIKDQCDL